MPLLKNPLVMVDPRLNEDEDPEVLNIYHRMNKGDFLKAVRRKSGKFRADNIVITTESGELDLKPRDRWQDLYTQWRKFRNPMSHRMSKDNKTEGSVADDMIAESRIAGAINCMILKLMNYTGFVRLSAFEDKYGKI